MLNGYPMIRKINVEDLIKTLLSLKTTHVDIEEVPEQNKLRIYSSQKELPTNTVEYPRNKEDQNLNDLIV